MPARIEVIAPLKIHQDTTLGHLSTTPSSPPLKHSRFPSNIDVDSVSSSAKRKKKLVLSSVYDIVGQRAMELSSSALEGRSSIDSAVPAIQTFFNGLNNVVPPGSVGASAEHSPRQKVDNLILEQDAPDVKIIDSIDGTLNGSREESVKRYSSGVEIEK